MRAGGKRQSVWFSYDLAVSKAANDLPRPGVTGSDEECLVDIQLRKYTSHYERYQFYMDISLKVIVSYYVVTAAILSFYLGSPENPYGKIAVLLPILLGVVWGSLFLYGGYLWRKARLGVLDLEKELIDEKLIIPPPDFHLLLWLLFVFGFLFLAVAASIFWVWRRGGA